MYQKLLIKPVLTEKMAIMQERENKYAFIVEKSANKNQIKDAIEKKFDVLVSKVATMNIDGKLKNMTTRSNGRTIKTQGRRSSYKKAIITLEEGYTIDLVRGEVEV
ncbi:MAG: 50S ribosomal protein L23 [Candidatus Neomarinimicrobiota bacterium]|jgi:large subunit ribosomal protein L23|uniref:50S ribosomal protein L23 n=1 Tax=marine metagenome TaxID=408172 RepID=A0A382L1G1_9ZZZZ|nr:50S ribosomal protein L23 [Candidatus Neomarinimicrobiota bacterium]MED5554345.1 50S ribosomal protein L23 [Candidatus Neomarinimicrobiota bacterium]MEE3152839.1 50S ribosomal protein L23 [Candidatus Neomarinimicrobiota bacterium]|tara:strand:- start:2621 stop:2938 length:318 start_codon:yes stop_codon:yes gene_type:complete